MSSIPNSLLYKKTWVILNFTNDINLWNGTMFPVYELEIQHLNPHWRGSNLTNTTSYIHTYSIFLLLNYFGQDVHFYQTKSRTCWFIFKSVFCLLVYLFLIF